jgi:hypothetical protein
MAFVVHCLEERRQRWATGLNASLIRSFDRRHTSIDGRAVTRLLVIDHLGCVEIQQGRYGCAERCLVVKD